MRRFMPAAAAVLATLLPMAPAAAQFTQYTEPGSLADPPTPARERVRVQAQEARWSLGKLKLEPRASIGDLGYVNDVFDSTDKDRRVSDVKGSAGLGLDGYFHLGPKVIVNGFAFGNYSWWREQEQLRVFNGSFGARAFGFFNRLELEFEGGRVERERNFSSELEVPVQIREDRAALAFEIDVRGPFAFFGSAAGQRTRHADDIEQNIPGLDVSTLDRDTQVFNLGVSYVLANGLTIGLGVERTDAQFEDDPGGRTNSGTGPLLRARYEGNQFGVSVATVHRVLEFDSRPGEDLEQLTGSLRASWKASEKTSLTVFGGQQLVYSGLDTDGVFAGERYGLAAQRRLTRRGRLSLFWESGRDEHMTTSGQPTGRIDQLDSLGGTFRYRLTRRVALRLGLRSTERDSSLPQFDRSFDSLVTGIDVGDNILPW